VVVKITGRPGIHTFWLPWQFMGSTAALQVHNVPARGSLAAVFTVGAAQLVTATLPHCGVSSNYSVVGFQPYVEEGYSRHQHRQKPGGGVK
jgi:hypothetical protein